MNLNEAIKLCERLISTSAEHQDYKRVVALAKMYKMFVTGVGIDLVLRRFVQRESEDAFKQRVEMTEAITPAVCASLEQPYNKTLRIDRVKKSFEAGSATETARLQQMVNSFWGDPGEEGRGVDYWLETEFNSISDTDPNAWVVIEWENNGNRSEVITPRPYMVSSAEAVNFRVVNDTVQWLFVKTAIKFLRPTPDPAVMEEVDGFKYTLYDKDITVQYIQVDEKYVDPKVEKGGQRWQNGSAFYYRKTFTPNLGYAPAFRIGYVKDKETDRRTFVNRWHTGCIYLRKSLKVVSEMDLTMNLHVFPQKIQYVRECPGSGPTAKCTNGIVIERGTGKEKMCKRCKGTGHIVHTTAQDVMLVPMPDLADGAAPLSLDNMVTYKSAPIETVKFQNEYILQLERQTHQAVFNSQAFVSKVYAAGQQAAGQEPPTATAEDYNMQSVYDVLKPYTNKISELYKKIVGTLAIIGSIKKVTIVHKYPSDLKLKTADVLLYELRQANDSGAPSFMIDQINTNLAEVIYLGDPVGLNRQMVQRYFDPFAGKSKEEIATLMQGSNVPMSSKILYANAGPIFRELEEDDPLFYTLERKEQKQMLVDKVAEWIERIDAEKPASPFMPQLPTGDTAPGGGPAPDDEDDTEETEDEVQE